MAAPPPPPQLPSLPPGWARYSSPEGKIYFANAQTRETSWTHPGVGTAVASLPTGFSSAIHHVAPPIVPAAITKTTRKVRAKYKDAIDGTPWLRIRTADGTIFFHNADTKSSSWVVPSDIMDLLPALDARLIAEKKKQLEEEFAKARAEAKAARPTENASKTAEVGIGSDHGEDEESAGEEMTEEQKIELAELRAEMDLQRGAIHKKRSGGDDNDDDERPANDKQRKKKRKIVGSLEDVDDEDWQREIAAEMAAEAEADHESGEEEDDPMTKQALVRAAPKGPPMVQETTEEQRALFKSMLAEADINPFHPWEMELPKFINDTRYGRVPKMTDRREIFEEHCRDKAREKRMQASGVKDNPAQAYRKLLVAEVTSTRTHWEDFRRTHKKDARFREFGRDDREREQAFKVWLRELGEIKRADAQRHEELFNELLLMQRDITPASSWADVKKNIAADPRYEAVASSSLREGLFNKYVARLAKTQDKESNAEARKAQEKLERQAASLREREEKVKRNKLAVEQAAGRSRSAAGHEEGMRELRALLIDSVRDHETRWQDALPQLQRDPRFSMGNLAPHEQRQLFQQHIDDLHAKRVAALEALFQSHAKALNTPFSDIYPLIVSDSAIARLHISPDQVERMFESWQRRQCTLARNEFDALLDESSFVSFWGAFRKEAIDKQAEDAARKALAGDEDDDAAGADGYDLRGLASAIDMREIEAVLKHDARFRIFDYISEQRTSWIRAHLDSLAAPKLSVHQHS